MIQKAAGKREAMKLLQHQAYSLVLSVLQSANVQPFVQTTMMLSWGIATPSIQQLYNNYTTTIQQPYNNLYNNYITTAVSFVFRHALQANGRLSYKIQ